MKIAAIDTETGLIGAGQIAPPFVCLSWAFMCEGKIEPESYIYTKLHKDKEGNDAVPVMLQAGFNDPDVKIVGANLAYDLVVLGNEYPSLWPSIFKMLDDGRAEDVQITEKLLNLSTIGNLGYFKLPDGNTKDISYALEALAAKYLGVDRSQAKKGPDLWRLRYIELRDVPLEKWPEEAKIYALNDAKDTLLVYTKQQELIKPNGPSSANTSAFQCAVQTSLFLDTCWGLTTDQARVAELEKHLNERLDSKRFEELYNAGILRPAVAPKPKKRGGMTKGMAESVDTKALKAKVEEVCKKVFMTPKMTEKGEISADGDMIEQLAPHDPLLALYQDRQEVIGLRSKYLPVVKNPIVYPQYNVLVETGRTSSRGWPKGQAPLFPSTNIQNQPIVGGDFSVRECYVARPGYVYCSVDYSALELCTLAQTTYDLFGQSVHREKINAGYDLHSYLGSHIALLLDGEFRKAMEETNPNMDSDELYKYFMAMKISGNAELNSKYKHYRKFAKPTGLGYPGGLGPDTFVDYARNPYGVHVDRDTAALLKNVWLSVYPEMPMYFDWINQQKDFGDQNNEFNYTSPMGMYRANCSFCEIANGKGLQTPAAEGAKLGVFAATRAMYDPSLGSPLYGARRVAFVHDEQLVEMPEEKSHEMALELSRIMVEAMKTICPDVTIKAEPALMRRWYKDAEPVYDAAKRLIPWTPKQENR